MGFRVGVMCGASGQIVESFLVRNAPGLREVGVEVPVVVLDEDRPTQVAPWRQLWRVARRQARIAGCSTPTAAARLVVYRTLTHRPTPPEKKPPSPSFPPGLAAVRAPTLNSRIAREAIRSAKCDLVCLMGARYLTRPTLQAIGVPIVNIHSSDPRWVRGGPVVVWEVLAGRPELMLVVHEVTEVLDSGAILAEAAQEIVYRGGLGGTTMATMAAARSRVADLFEQVIRDVVAGTPHRIDFTPGSLKVTPSVRDSLRAELLCRHRSATHRARTRTL